MLWVLHKAKQSLQAAFQETKLCLQRVDALYTHKVSPEKVQPLLT